MAKVELKYGKDAKLRKLAKDVIAAQDKEIAFMKQWLAAASAGEISTWWSHVLRQQHKRQKPRNAGLSIVTFGVFGVRTSLQRVAVGFERADALFELDDIRRLRQICFAAAASAVSNQMLSFSSKNANMVFSKDLQLNPRQFGSGISR